MHYSQLSLIEINANNKGFDKFFEMCEKVSDRQYLRKKKYIRGNQSLFMNTTWTKEIMNKTKWRNNFLINRTDENLKKKKYTRRWHFYVSLLRKTSTAAVDPDI